jgi:hypothetical protein
MISMKVAILAGAVVIGAAGITAYASGAFCTAETTETAQSTMTQTILTSGGDKSCCADDAGVKKTVAQNAVFTPTVQAAALSGGTCPATATQTTAAASASCGAKATVTTASLTSAEKSCCATDGVKKTTSKTTLAGVVPTATATN